jgi:HAD superfamily hydrolase (TIGR01509 family)
MPDAVKFLLWDFDGVLVDTERWYFEATRLALGEVGVRLSQERYLEFMTAGRSCWELARQAELPETEIQELRNRRDETYREFLRTKPIEIPGVPETLAALAGRYRMAIVTTARRADFDLIHAGRDLLRHFEFSLTIEDYPRQKPAPDPYLAAIVRFGADPKQFLAIEDSARGLHSARAAGIGCIVIKNSFTQSLDFAGALRILDSVSELPGVLAR